MKKYFFTLIILAILCPGFVYAKKVSTLDEYFDKYSGKEGYSTIHITKYMFDLFTKISAEDDAEYKETMNKLTAIKILSLKTPSNNNKQTCFPDELNDILSDSRFKELMIIKDGEKTIEFKIIESNDKISMLAMTVCGQGDYFLMWLEGEINLKDVAKISRSTNIQGFEHLQKLDNKQP